LNNYNVNITIRDRAETVDLCKSFGIDGQVIGTDYFEKNKKALYMIYRTLKLASSTPKFDASIGFENGMGVFASKLRMKPSILFCDNDLKFSQNKSSAQDLETKIKGFADYIVIPEVCRENFSISFDESKLITYDGCKEDIYIADYAPDPTFMDKLPFDDFVVIRPEALASFYVKENKSIVNDLISRFNKENVNVVYLPREKEDIKYAEGCDYYTPEKPLNGLDICYYADAVLTGSGTLAREAACMGTKSISFFPSKKLLSVDQRFVNQSKVLHSRDVDEIVDYTLSQQKNQKSLDLDRCKLIKKEAVDSVTGILSQV
jgi:predicted glycosyltransferase